MDHLESVRAFCAIARFGGFTAASGALNMPVARVSKLVQALETRLGSQLLLRTTRSVRLTEAGARYLQQMKPILDEIDQIEGHLADMTEQVAGKIKLALPLDYGCKVVLPVLDRFASTHPQVQLDLAFSDAKIDLTKEGFDLAIRIARMQNSSLIARPLRTTDLVCAASPAYLASHAAINTPQDLAAHDCLRYSFSETDHVWEFYQGQRSERARVNGRIRLNNGDAIARLLVAGQGVAMQPRFILQPYLDSGELTPILTQWHSKDIPINVVYPQREFMPKKVAALIEFLRQQLP